MFFDFISAKQMVGIFERPGNSFLLSLSKKCGVVEDNNAICPPNLHWAHSELGLIVYLFRKICQKTRKAALGDIDLPLDIATMKI